VVFGAAKSNASSNDHSAALANCDTTADKLTPDAISLMKRMAKQANGSVIVRSGDTMVLVTAVASKSAKETAVPPAKPHL
jgi:ribonuclease PH